ncbi:MAG: hypothetical protein ACRC46_04935 [Thermoguttaceae bacterium]
MKRSAMTQNCQLTPNSVIAAGIPPPFRLPLPAIKFYYTRTTRELSRPD